MICFSTLSLYSSPNLIPYLTLLYERFRLLCDMQRERKRQGLDIKNKATQPLPGEKTSSDIIFECFQIYWHTYIPLFTRDKALEFSLLSVFFSAPLHTSRTTNRRANPIPVRYHIVWIDRFIKLSRRCLEVT